MLISHKHKFIFIHTFKTGGTSLTNMLLPYCEDNNYYFNQYGHITPYDIKNDIKNRGEISNILTLNQYKKYFKFAFIRNPWDWHVSHFYGLKHYNNLNYWNEIDINLINKNFNDYLIWYHSVKHRTAIDWTIGVDKVYKFEEYSKSILDISKILNIELSSINHDNKTKHLTYHHYYNDFWKNKIYDEHKREIDLYKYDFYDNFNYDYFEYLEKLYLSVKTDNTELQETTLNILNNIK